MIEHLVLTPSQLRWSLTDYLPDRPVVQVISRDTSEKRCPMYLAHHYEVVMYYPNMGKSRSALRTAIEQYPGIYQATDMPDVSPDWPVRYRSPDTFRPQVRALWRTLPLG